MGGRARWVRRSRSSRTMEDLAPPASLGPLRHGYVVRPPTPGAAEGPLRLHHLDELGIPDHQRAAPRVGHSTEGKPGTRKTRYGKSQKKWGR